MSSESGLYQIVVTNISGEPVSLSAYAGRVLLIVNVASECGFAKQYQQLQILYDKYHKQGFDVLAFPCNQFNQQEPSSNAQIKTICDRRFKVTYPVFQKIAVNGANAHPLYQYLTSKKKGWFFTRCIKWNFTKFLISKNGDVLTRYAPYTSPFEIECQLEKLF